jgi:hypothetical protein
MVKVRLTVFDCAGLPASVTVKVSGVALADAVGVPLRTPVEALNVRPAGRAPDASVQLYGAVPPVAARVALYVVPTTPFASDVVVIASVTGEMVRDRVTDLVCAGLLESVAVKVSAVALTAVVGVPLRTPLAAFMVRPAGRVPAVKDQLYGVVPPIAVKVAL